MSIGKGRFSAGRNDHCGPLARLLQAADGGQGLRAGDQREVEAARPDLPGRLGGEHVGHRPADARVAAPRRRRPQPFGQPGHGVVVLPGLRVDDVDALERAEDRRGVLGAGVVRGGAGRLLPHVERLGRAARATSDGCQVWRATPMMQVARGSALNALPSTGPGQERDLPGMAMARSAMMFFWISVEPPPMVE